ncbi:hypothetical protein QBC46DRAFT_347769 [Diplogelasinospora grovesii]|uniref:Uncharacterized protein n=1 Tax=Diplogelasinospora grovesii TaxID=303347 RepID=A0AAN6MWE9_9PEZI|nr:hypothetical protein QBC46DRAFT_347769 [Diplogelasinospora grovesii]
MPEPKRSITVGGSGSVNGNPNGAGSKSPEQGPKASTTQPEIRETIRKPRLPADGAAATAADNDEDDEDDDERKYLSGQCTGIIKPVIIRSMQNMSYENANLEDIELRQLYEDIAAYEHDQRFCDEQLVGDDLTPQESRTFQLRMIDLGHQIRKCRHRIEKMEHEQRQRRGLNRPAVRLPQKRPFNHTNVDVDDESNAKKQAKMAVKPEQDANDQDEDTITCGEEDNTALKRLGFWRCRLCTSEKYLLAGAGRVPASPCKWPLKDIAKMIVHFTEMHKEHTAIERCKELGAALGKNCGPFEYWLRRTRSQNIGDDNSVVRDCIDDLNRGKVPHLLRQLSRAAANMPTT